MAATGGTERAARLGAEQQLHAFLRKHLDPVTTGDAVALVLNLTRAVREEERFDAQQLAASEHEDRLRRADAVEGISRYGA